MSHKEIEHLLKMFNQAWDEALWSPPAKTLSKYPAERPPAPRLHPPHDQNPDVIILEANQSFLKSLESIRNTNQSYLDILQQEPEKSGVPNSSRSIISRLPPTPRIPQLDPRHVHDVRDGKENSDPRQSPDTDACAEKLRSMGLAGN